jgi:hypothetical protein
MKEEDKVQDGTFNLASCRVLASFFFFLVLQCIAICDYKQRSTVCVIDRA